MPKRKSAFSQAIEEAQRQSETASQSASPETSTQQNSATVPQFHRETATPQSNINTASQQGSETVSQQERSKTVSQQDSETAYTEKISFYLTPEQADKLDDLAHAYKKRTHKRINRNHIVRHLIEQCSIESLTDLEL
jgi:hypothetical protein